MLYGERSSTFDLQFKWQRLYSFTVGTCPSPYSLVETRQSTSKCVFISTSRVSWVNAKQQCEDGEDYLLSFASKNESVAFGNYLFTQGKVR